MRHSIFARLFDLYETFPYSHLSPKEQEEISRVFEFAASTQEGIHLLYRSKRMVFGCLKQMFNPEASEKQVLYPAATVLLDLTANEHCIERVAQLLQENQMFEFIFGKLLFLLSSPNYVKKD